MNVSLSCMLLVIFCASVVGHWCTCDPPSAKFSPMDDEQNGQRTVKEEHTEGEHRETEEEIEIPEEQPGPDDEEQLQMNEEQVQEDKTAFKLPLITMLRQLINTTQSCEITRNFEVPAIEENRTSYFLGQGGHIMFTLSLGDPSAVDIKIRDNAVFVAVPLMMDNLVYDMEQVDIFVDGHNEYNIELKLDVIKNIPVTLTLVAYKKQNECDKAVFDFKLNEFHYTLNFLNNIKNSGLSKRVKEEMWGGIMSKIQRMVEIYSLYLMRRAFQGLGSGFGDELCVITDQ